MTKNKPHPISRLIRLVAAMPVFFRVVTNVIHLVEEDIEAGRKKIIILLIYLFVFSTLVTSTWLLLLATCFAYLISMHLTMHAALFILLVINILLLTIVGLIILKLKNRKFFSHSRKLLMHLKSQFHI